MGAADTISVVIRSSLVQLETPDEMRGRVGAVNSLFIGTSNQLGEFESGVTASLFGTVWATVLGGVGTLAVAFLWMRFFPLSGHSIGLTRKFRRPRRSPRGGPGLMPSMCVAFASSSDARGSPGRRRRLSFSGAMAAAGFLSTRSRAQVALRVGVGRIEPGGGLEVRYRLVPSGQCAKGDSPRVVQIGLGRLEQHEDVVVFQRGFSLVEADEPVLAFLRVQSAWTTACARLKAIETAANAIQIPRTTCRPLRRPPRQ